MALAEMATDARRAGCPACTARAGQLEHLVKMIAPLSRTAALTDS